MNAAGPDEESDRIGKLMIDLPGDIMDNSSDSRQTRISSDIRARSVRKEIIRAMSLSDEFASKGSEKNKLYFFMSIWIKSIIP